MTEAEKAYQYFVIAVPENEEQAKAYFWARKALQPTLTPPNEPLTIEQLREMDGQPVYVASAIGEHSAWYIVDLEENELKNPWDRISLENWDEGYPYTAYRCSLEGKEDTNG